jgi:hypothetical protein
MDLPSMYTPAGADSQGRDTCAKLIVGALSKSAGNEPGVLRKVARREFPEAEIMNMLTRLRTKRHELRKGVGLRAGLAEFSAPAREAGVRISDRGVNKVDRPTRAPTGVGTDLSAFKRLPRGQLTKGASVPLESSNAANDQTARMTAPSWLTQQSKPTARPLVLARRRVRGVARALPLTRVRSRVAGAGRPIPRTTTLHRNPARVLRVG